MIWTKAFWSQLTCCYLCTIASRMSAVIDKVPNRKLNGFQTSFTAAVPSVQVVQTRRKKTKKIRSLIWMTQIFSMTKKRVTATKTQRMQMILIQKMTQIRSRMIQTMMGWGSFGKHSISHRTQQQKLLQHLQAASWMREQLPACLSMRGSSCACKSELPSWRLRTWLRRTGSCKERLAQVRATLHAAAG